MTDRNPTVSIIVPVYNAQDYIRRCVDSILHQEYDDFELLLMDDGSRDSSGEICDEYAARDERVRVFHKENSGVSDTRNQAIRQARGIYLQFADSDDWLTPDATKRMVRAAEDHQCDLVISDFYRVVGERLSQKGDIEEEGVMNLEEFAGHMMENPADFYYGVLWNKLYRRDLVTRHQLCMDDTISWCEDFMFNLEYIRHADRVYALRAPVYYYVKRKGSLVSQGTSITKVIKMKLMVFEYYNNFYKHVLDEDDYEKNRRQVYRFLVDAAGDGSVPPSILPGAKRLGEERTSVCAAVVEGEGMITDAYRDRKLLDHYLEIAAYKNDLTLKEARLMLYLSQPHQIRSRKELADYTDMSRRSLSTALQRLVNRGMIKIEETLVPKKSEIAGGDVEIQVKQSRKGFTKQMKISILPAAESVLSDITVAQNDYDHAKYADFTEEELVQYAYLTEKIKENICRVLQ